MSDLNSELMEQKKKVDFNTYDLSVKELISMVNDNLINIAPDYQRKFRWKADRQSSLIESLFLGIPVPSLFMASNADGTWEVIDGVQRLSTMICFAGDENALMKINSDNAELLKLTGLEKLSSFNGKKFCDLPIGIQNKFRLTSVKVTTLSDKSDLDVRFDLFERLNKGGVNLTPQEIRSCVYKGGFNNFLKKMSCDENYNHCVHLSETQETDGTREELVLRFFAYLYDLESFEHSVIDFLNDYMKKATQDFDYLKNEQLFRYVFKTLNDALPKGITKGRNNTPLNLFEAVAVGAAKAYIKKGYINTNGIEQWIQDEELLKNITGATNSKPKAIGRISFCQRKFEE